VAQLLLVEDDAEIRRSLIRALTGLGHVVASVPAGLPALQAVLDERPDLVVLDLGLPDVDGREILRMLRSVSAVPVIVATARDGEQAIVEALDLGADDYVCKPFGPAQLDARIRAVLRRAATNAGVQPPALTVGGLQIDPATRRVSIDGDPVELTAREFDLLHYLAGRAGVVVTKRELVAQVWRQPLGNADKTVDVHISWLRRKLGEDARAPRFLHTVRGVGFRLADPGANEAEPA
jgi:two-component system, OmpR family, KDP operon response regulator KdpE